MTEQLSRGHQLVGQQARRLTATELARRTGTSPSMVRHIAAGRKTPGTDLRDRLVAHGVPSDAWDEPAETPSAENAPSGRSGWCEQFLAANAMTPADFLELLEIVLTSKPELANALADGFRELGEAVSELSAHEEGSRPR